MFFLLVANISKHISCDIIDKKQLLTLYDCLDTCVFYSHFDTFVEGCSAIIHFQVISFNIALDSFSEL